MVTSLRPTPRPVNWGARSMGSSRTAARLHARSPGPIRASVSATGRRCIVGCLIGALGGIRTPNLLIRSQMLYPLSYERWLVRHTTGIPGADARSESSGWASPHENRAAPTAPLRPRRPAPRSPRQPGSRRLDATSLRRTCVEVSAWRSPYTRSCRRRQVFTEDGHPCREVSDRPSSLCPQTTKWQRTGQFRYTAQRRNRLRTANTPESESFHMKPVADGDERGVTCRNRSCRSDGETTRIHISPPS